MRRLLQQLLCRLGHHLEVRCSHVPDGRGGEYVWGHCIACSRYMAWHRDSLWEPLKRRARVGDALLADVARRMRQRLEVGATFDPADLELPVRPYSMELLRFHGPEEPRKPLMMTDLTDDEKERS